MALRLASFTVNGHESYGAVTDQGIVDLGRKLAKYPTLRDVLRAQAVGEARAAATGAADYQLKDVTMLPPIPQPEKNICVGINYPDRGAEYKDGPVRPPQKYPNLFMRVPTSLVGTGPAPHAPLATGGSRRLFWDPRFMVAGGPYTRIARDLSESWTATARLFPGVALVEERGAAGSDLVPHLTAEAGARWEGMRLSASLDLFYSQGRFDGYRAYGARISVSALDGRGAGSP